MAVPPISWSPCWESGRSESRNPWTDSLPSLVFVLSAGCAVIPGGTIPASGSDAVALADSARADRGVGAVGWILMEWMSRPQDEMVFGTPLRRVEGRFSPSDLHLLLDLVEEVRCLYGPRLQSVKLVGSRARGTGKPDSDFDFLLFLDECDFEVEIPRLQELGARLGRRHGLGPLSISPLSREQFLGLDSRYEGILDNFRRDAIDLLPNGSVSRD